MKFGGRRVAVATVVLGAISLAACGDDGSSAVDTLAPTESSTIETSTTETSATESSTVDTEAPAESMRGKRYCEILLLAPTDNGIRATVYNTFPLNDCPDDEWRAIDTAQVAEDEGVVFALANGPRYWLMDAVGRDTSDVISTTFGTLEMNRYATVDITDPSSIGLRFVTQRVDRRATFVFRAGHTIHQLIDPDGRRFVMQSWSQQVDPTLTEDGLVDLGARIALPEGWSYEVVTLEEDLVVGADRSVAEVLQDDLLNSYSLIG